MSKQAKRTRTIASKTASTGITIVSKVDAQGYVFHLVQGWQENGKWQRRRFKDRSDAETFAAAHRVQMENKGRAQRMVLSPLTDSQHEEALQAFDKLAGTYTLAAAVDYFLKHHRPPEFTIRAKDALKLYIDDKEREGVRDRTLVAIKSVLNQFITATDNPWIHEITASNVESYLRGLRAKNGKDKATQKTWNNYRNDLGGFFAWCSAADAGTNRPFTFENPVTGVRKFSARQVREGQDAKPQTTSPGDTIKMFSALIRWRDGVLARYFAYLYFAGIRPDELKRISNREAELVNLKTRTITIPANVSKTRQERQVTISDNLAAWLESTTSNPIVPANFDRLVKMARKHFKLSHDEARHSFISYHVALHRSIGDAALQAGNSESIVKRHYLNTHTREEGAEFFRIVPGKRRAVLAKPAAKSKPHLKVV